jgi:hypothetical protein
MFSAGGAVLEALEGDHLVQRMPRRPTLCTGCSVSERCAQSVVVRATLCTD